MSVVVDKTVTARLADHVRGLRVADIPTEVLHHTKDLLVHHLGLAFREHGMPRAEQAMGVVGALGGSSGGSTIVGTRQRGQPTEAVFANSLLMAHDGMDDFQFPAGLHCGILTQPVAWVIGEHTRASGAELLAAVVAGYDVAAKLANTVWTWTAPTPRRPNAVFGPLAAAATAARLLGLSASETVHALGHASQMSMGLVEGGEVMGTQYPLLARNGLTAAVVAGAGFESTPRVIEGEHGLFRSFFGAVPDGLDDNLATLGDVFEISKAETKRYRSSALNIVPMQLALDLAANERLTADDVAAVVTTLPVEREVREGVWEGALLGPAANSSNRAGSLRFQQAIIFAEGTITASRYETTPDHELLALLDRIELKFEIGHPYRYARVEVETTDGRHLVAEADDHSFAPVVWSEWLAEGGQRLLTGAQLTRLESLIGGLEDVDDVSEVTACTVPNGPD